MGGWEVEGTAAEAHWKGRAHGVWGPWARGARKFRDFVAENGDFLGKIEEILGMDGGEKMGES